MVRSREQQGRALYQTYTLRQPVEVAAFVERMVARWVDYGLEPSKALRQNWAQLCEVLNLKLSQFHTAEFRQWHTLCLQTGTGKTEGVILYAIMVSEFASSEDHAGLLIVSPFTAEADRIARKINKLFDKDVAVSWHSKKDNSGTNPPDWPVLVIAHEEYRRSMRNALFGDRTKFNRLFGFWNLSGERRLVVIDEGINLIKHRTVTTEKLALLTSLFPEIRSSVESFKTVPFHDSMVDACTYVERLLNWLNDRGNDPSTAELRRHSPPGFIGDSQKHLEVMSPLRNALRGFPYDTYLSNLRDEKHRRDQQDRFEGYVDDLESLFWANSVVHRISGPYRVLITSDFLKPANARGCVVLDATSGLNVRNFLDARVRQHPRIANARSYSNVTLRISRAYSPSKTVMRRDGHEIANDVMEYLNATLRMDNRALLVCHKEAMKNFEGHAPGFELHLCGWGNVAGKNEWQYCDTVAICSVPFRDGLETPGEFYVLQGPDESTWTTDPIDFEDSEGLTFKQQHDDTMAMLYFNPVISDVVQAINRGRCRRVIDSGGNCSKMNVYMILPRGKYGEMMLAALEREMPNIQITTWNLPTASNRQKKAGTESALLMWAETVKPGTYAVPDVAGEIRVEKDALRQLLHRDSKKRISDLTAELHDLGVHAFKDNGRWKLQKRT